MIDKTEQIRQAAENEEYSAALACFNELDAMWKEAERMFALYFRHSEYESVATSIATLRGYAQFGERPELASECDAVVEGLRHLNESQQVTWENIF